MLAMEVPNTARRKVATGPKRRRIRPSRARGLRTKTGCLTCRERRVKCDDGKPTCVRCSKSDRVCRYAPAAPSVGPASSCATPRAPPTAGETGPIDALQSPPEPPATAHTPYFAPPGSTPVDSAVSLPPNGAIETPQRGHGHNASHDPRLPSLDSAFSASPLALSQISLLDISPFEWYDLLARDANSNIQRRTDAATGDPRWIFPEIALSQRPSPVPDGPETQLEPARRPSAHPRLALEHPDDRIDPRLDHPQLAEPWNTTETIELSPIDLTFFRYYIDVVGPMLDLFDPGRHFTNLVPHLALRNTGLLKSILAVGAKHMSLEPLPGSGEEELRDHATSPAHTPGSQAAADPAPAHMATQYYYETLQYLSQTLLYPSYADSREILATATMISTYEMFDADSAATNGDWEKHLRGSFWIQRSQDNDGESVDALRRAVWWAWLRQDIWAAFRARRPTLTFWRARKRLEDLTTDQLATRIVYICGKCVAYAASEEMTPHQDPRQRIEQGNRLLRALDEWHQVLPASFQPVTVAKDPDCQTVFPPIWIHPPNHAGAMQMYHFARALVLLNQPTMGGLNDYCLRDKQLTESVKMVCGIANACLDHECAIAFVNVQALFGVGQFVRSPEMRSELLQTLERMLRISKFPARGLVAELKKVWQE